MERRSYINLNLFIALLISFWTWPTFAASCLYSKKINTVSCKKSITNAQDLDVEPTFIAYRLAVIGSSERKCRLEPTCSKFLVQAIKYHGLGRGIILGFARSQIKHDDAFGLLPKFVLPNEGMIVILDPVSNWSFFE
jgi:hypothetical protein